MKYFVLAALMLVAGLALTQLQREEEHFTPVVRVRTSTGLFLTFIQHETAKKSLCDEAVEALVGEFNEKCEACAIESTECARKLEGVDFALARKSAVPLYVVDSEELRIGILGPPDSVRRQCEALASHMVRGGVKSATCVPPSTQS